MKLFAALLFALIRFSHLDSDQLIWAIPPDTISTKEQNASDPQVGIDSSGNVLAVWIENNVLMWSQKIIGKNWDSPKNLSNSNASSPCLVVDASGNATAVWIEEDSVMASSKSMG